MLGVVAPLLALLGIEASSVTERIRRQAMLWGLIAVLGVIFIACLLVAAHAALVDAFGPIIAPLIMAIAAGVLAVIVYLVSNLQSASAARKEAERQRVLEANAQLAVSMASLLPGLLKSSLLREIALPAGALLAGVLFLRKRSRRRED